MEIRHACISLKATHNVDLDIEYIVCTYRI